MIISRIQYGLGNQLFQYALGRRLAKERGQELKLDLTWFDNSTIDRNVKIRDYELGAFAVNESLADSDEIHQFRYFDNRMSTRLKIKMCSFLSQYPGKGYVLEQGRHDGASSYNEEQFLDTPDIFLEGCWQSYKYFAPIEGELRKSLTFNFESDDANNRMLEDISNSQSVGIHIRKGDYLHPQFKDGLGSICSAQYYQQAIDTVLKYVEAPVFFIFTDDKHWVLNNIELEIIQSSIVDVNHQGEAHKDMFLLSKCKHMILSNSTFSWWAAWFNENKDNLIVCPEKWRMGGEQYHPGFADWINI